MASPAFQAISARACRQCRQWAARGGCSRYASTSSVGFGDIVESSRPLPRRRAGPSANLTKLFHFELVQASPSQRKIWQHLNAIHDAAPSELTAETLQLALPFLQRYNKPVLRRASVGQRFRSGMSENIVAVTEEAEALYARYRFVVQRLQDLGANPQSETQMSHWLTAFKELGYAPAAVRLLEDWKETHERTSQGLCHLALVAMARWLTLLHENDGSVSRVNEAKAQAKDVIASLEQAGLANEVTRSLRLRITKASSSLKETARLLRDEFDLNLDYPSQRVGLSSTPSGRPAPIKKDTLNTILSIYAANNDLSRMISLFESAAYPSPAAIEQERPMRQPSFFSSTAPSFFSLSSQVPASHPSPLANTSDENDNDFFDDATDVSPVASASLSVESAITTTTFPAIDTSAVNTDTFQTIIETSVRLGRYGIAQHYLSELHQAWQQERIRTQGSYEALSAYDIPLLKEENDFILGHEQSTGPNEHPVRPDYIAMRLDPARPSLAQAFQENLQSPAVGPSVHAVFTLYKSLWDSGQHDRYRVPMKRLIAETNVVLQKLRSDIAYWTEILDKKRVFQILKQKMVAEEQEGSALSPTQDSVVAQTASRVPLEHDSRNLSESSKQRVTQESESALQPFQTKLRVMLDRRTEIELSELGLLMDRRQAELSTDSFVQRLMYELSGKRRKGTIPRIRAAMHRAERWLVEDRQADPKRLSIIKSCRAWSSEQKAKRLGHAQRKYQGRREKVLHALNQARAALPHLEEEKAALRQLQQESARQIDLGNTPFKHAAAVTESAPLPRSTSDSSAVSVLAEPHEEQSGPIRLAYS